MDSYDTPGVKAMLFATASAGSFLIAQATESSSWLQTVIQIGSLGVLAYYFLFVQPEIARYDRAARMDEIRLLISIFAGERSSFEERADGIEKELKSLTEKRVCKIDTPGGGWFRDIPAPKQGPHQPGERV